MGIIIVFSNRVSDRFKKHGFTRFWRGDDQTTLSAPDGSNQVNDTTGDIRWLGFQIKHLAGEDRGQDIKMGTTFSDFGVYTVNSLNT